MEYPPLTPEEERIVERLREPLTRAFKEANEDFENGRFFEFKTSDEYLNHIKYEAEKLRNQKY